MDSTATSSAQAAPVAPVAAAAAPAPVDAAQALQQQQLTVVRDTTGRFVSPPAATDSTSGQKRSAHDASLESTQDAKRAEPERGGATSAAAAAAAAAAPPMTADMIMAMSKFGNEMIEREQARARAAAAAAATPTPVPQQQQQQAPAAAAAAPVASQQTVMSEEDKRRYEELRQWAAEKAAADAAVAAEGLQRMQSVLTAQAASGAQGDAARQLAEWMKNDTFIKSRQGQEMLMRAARLSTTTTPQTVMVTASAGAPPQQQQQAPVQQQQPQQVPTGYFSQASMGTMVHASAAQRPAAEPVSAAPLSEYKQVLNEYIRRSVVEEAAGFERAMRMAGVPIEYAAFGAPTGPVPQGGMRINASAAATEKRVHPLHEIIAQGFRNMHERFKGMEMTSTRVRRIGYDRDGQPILGV